MIRFIVIFMIMHNQVVAGQNVESSSKEIQLSANAFKNIIDTYFSISHHDGILAFLCQEYDFIDMHLVKNIKFGIFRSRSSLINEDIFFDQFDYLNMGVFLDMTCAEGSMFLQKLAHKDIFTDLHRLLLWNLSVSTDFDSLQSLDLSIDTDIILIVSNSSANDSTIHMYDVYKIHKSKEILREYIGFIRGDGEMAVLKRPVRNNFYGFKMNAVHVPLDLPVNNTEDALDIHVDMFYRSSSNPIPRYSLSQLLDLRGIYNFSYNYTFVESWGREDKDGNWNGMMGVLQRHEAELGFAHVYMRRDRKRVADFRYSFIDVKILFVFIQPSVFGVATALTVPFTYSLWIVIIVSCFITSVIIWFTSKHEEEVESDFQSSTSFVIGSLTQQGSETPFQRISGRLVAVTILFYFFFVNLYYNVAVLNGLLAPLPSSITNLRKLLDSSLRIGAFDEPYFRDVSEDGLWGPKNKKRLELETRMLSGKHGMYYKDEEGVENLKKENFALLIEEFSYHRNVQPWFSETQMCMAQEVKHELPRVICGVAFARQSPYRNLLTIKLIWQDEVGLRKLHADKWNFKFMPPCGNLQQSISIGMTGLTVAYEILLTGIFISLMIFIVERVLWLQNNK